MRPALTKLTVITVVALLLWMMEVTPSPTRTATTRLFVRGTAALDDGGNTEPHENCHHPIVREGLQDPPQPVPRDPLESLGHKSHPDEKESQPPSEPKDEFFFHKGYPPIPFPVIIPKPIL